MWTEQMKFHTSKTGLSSPLPHSSFPTDHSKVVPLLQSFFVHLWFHMWLLFYRYLFLISPFGALAGLSFMIVAFITKTHLFKYIENFTSKN